MGLSVPWWLSPTPTALQCEQREMGRRRLSGRRAPFIPSWYGLEFLPRLDSLIDAKGTPPLLPLPTPPPLQAQGA